MQEVHLSIGFIGMYICETVYGTLIVEIIEYLVLESLKGLRRVRGRPFFCKLGAK